MAVSLKVTASETDINVTNNTSYVNVSVSVTSSGTSYNTGGDAYINGTLTGQNNTYSILTTYYTLSQNSTKTVYTEKIGPFTHNANGSLNPVSIYVYCKLTNNTNTSSTTSCSMSTIARASKPLLSSGDVAVDSSVTINTNRASTNFTHILKYTPPNSSTSYTIAENVGANYTWLVPVSLLQYFPSSSLGVFKITCDTYNGSSYIGTNSVNINIYARGYDYPEYTLSIAESNQNVINSRLGLYIQNKSQIKITLSNITLSYGSQLASCKLSITDSNGTELWKSTTTPSGTATNITATSSTITKSGTITVSASLTDKRGKTHTKTTTFTSAAYSVPQITSVSATRSYSNGVENPSGTYLKYTFIGSITSLSGNSRLFEIGYRRKGSGSYTYTTISSTSYTISRTGYTLNLNLNADYEYDIAFRATDSLGSTIIERSIGTDFKLINWNSSGKSMAFGTISNRGSNETYLDCDLTLNCTNGFEINGTKVDNFILDMMDLGTEYFYNMTESGRSLTANTWTAMSSENRFTDYLPPGKYLIIYEGAISAGSGIATFDPYLDGSRTDDRQSVPTASTLISSGTCIVYKKWTTADNHTINLYVYPNTTASVQKTSIRVIRIG